LPSDCSPSTPSLSTFRSYWLGRNDDLVRARAPLLFASAQRFRLHNTRWRALRFEFTATRVGAYRAVLIVVGIWLSTTLAAALGGELSVAVVGAITALLLPWMHHRLKAFPALSRCIRRPSLGVPFRAWKLLRPRTSCGIHAHGRCPPGSLLGGAVVSAVGMEAGAVAWVFGALSGAFAYLAAWPYFAARMQHAVWTRTTIGPYEFRTTIRFGTLLPIAIKNVALLVVTAGLYWP
jgi:uncharacterized membrane protein YjgN (DUF898 family)